MDRKQKTIIFLIVTLVITIIGVAIIENINSTYNKQLIHEVNNKAKENLAALRFELESALVNDIYLTSTLADIATIDFQNRNEVLNKISEAVILKSGHLTSVGFAKDDIIDFVYPFESNAKAIGLVYKNKPEQWKDIKKARMTKQILISGPISLIQGGKALIVRVPVFYDYPNKNKYWGVISGVINYDKLFETLTSMKNFEKYDLSIVDVSDSRQTSFIYGQPKVIDNYLFYEEVKLPYGKWGIYLSHSKHNTDYFNDNVRIIAYPLLFCFIILFLSIAILYITNEHRAYHDALTKTPNRRYLIKKLAKIFKQAKLGNIDGTFIVVNIDIDKFKHINDNYGHAAGDKVLTVLSKRIENNLRKNDIVARMGGDEFLLLINFKNDSINIKDRVINIVNDVTQNTILFDGKQIPISITSGYVVYDESIANFWDMLILADKSMYNKKTY
ncbi:diguanylate cyclase domain-containing protein [Photobacterium aquimaris]|uniref:Putative diguanylate cyclase AdrA n=1 Tax=Photobacterium aquimaris TaxID=512643 RepID=A0A1Y6KSX0_9GAMM|nr:diguanylate cyclase [Photobacterium aquimaris]SMY15269.1 putative diguanylate cyclase AdrA [Photobacterium aquimaris]